MVPTLFCIKALGMFLAISFTALKPEQWQGMRNVGFNSSSSSTVLGIIGSKIPPDRCIPPITAYILSSLVSSFAYFRVFIIPECQHPVITTSPLSLIFKIIA